MVASLQQCRVAASPRAVACRAKSERLARDRPYAERDDLESAWRAAHHRGEFSGRTRGASKARRPGPCLTDCEALERRHNLGRGTLVVLDAVPESGTPTYVERRAMLEALLPCHAVFGGDAANPVPCGAVVLTPTLRVDSHAEALAFY